MMIKVADGKFLLKEIKSSKAVLTKKEIIDIKALRGLDSHPLPESILEKEYAEFTILSKNDCEKMELFDQEGKSYSVKKINSRKWLVELPTTIGGYIYFLSSQTQSENSVGIFAYHHY